MAAPLRTDQWQSDHSGALPLGSVKAAAALCCTPLRSTTRRTELGLVTKRAMDVLLSLMALLLLWPLMAVIAVAIRWESRGPVIFRSRRVGKRGQDFTCYKFRSMIAGADSLQKNLLWLNQRRGPFFKIADDPRITRVGHLLRKYSLDELPQFWNVFTGDMTLVGPRPHPLDDVARYQAGHHRRLEVKPGLTGLWQVTARRNPSFETCMTLDLKYIERWSLLLDFRILLRTVPEVFSGRGQ